MSQNSKVTRDQHGLANEEMGIISGTLDMRRKTVKDIMTPIEKMFMISDEISLSGRQLEEVREKGKVPINLSCINSGDLM